MRTALAITAVGALSYVLRVVPLVAIGRVDIGPRLDRAIRHAGAAAVTALFVGAVLHGGGGGGPRPAVLVAAGAAVWAATRGAAMLRVVLVGAVSYGAALCLAAAVW